jgi:cyclic pyranopterin phosphate synthase
MPEEGVPSIPHEAVLRYEEIFRIIETARSLGFRRFRITGGEPLVRRGIFWLLNKLYENGIDYTLTSNGFYLGKYAKDLRSAGLRRINIGLDTLDEGTFERITRAKGLARVLRGIDAIRNAGIGTIKINVVVMRGINDMEMEDFISWAAREALHIRFIEYMPVGDEDFFVSLQPVMRRFRERADVEPVRLSGEGPACYFRCAGTGGMVGFILPRSEPFCESCNRLRLTSDGVLLPCLFSRQGVSLRAALRSGGGLAPFFERAIRLKPEGHNLSMRLHRYKMHALGG